jgi:hypothetical protein
MHFERVEERVRGINGGVHLEGDGRGERFINAK